jgi:hypothetical protein
MVTQNGIIRPKMACCDMRLIESAIATVNTEAMMSQLLPVPKPSASALKPTRRGSLCVFNRHNQGHNAALLTCRRKADISSLGILNVALEQQLRSHHRV